MSNETDENGRPLAPAQRDTAPAGTAPADSAPAATEAERAVLAELRAHEERELTRTLRVLARARAGFAVVLVAWGLVFLALEPTRWQAALLFGASGVVALMVAIERRALPLTGVSPQRIVYFLVTVMTFHTAIIVATGGIESPFVVLYIPALVIGGFALGAPALFASVAALPVVVIAVLGLGSQFELLPEFLPRFLGGEAGPRPASAWIWFYMFVVAGTSVLGGILGLTLRRALDRASHAAALARHEAVLTMQERNRELVALSGSLAHELKNPLASIQGLASLMARHLPEGSREAEQMAVLRAEVLRMGAILEEFLNFSRPVSGLAARTVRPSELVGDVVTVHEGLAARHDVELVAAVEQDEPVRVDPRKVKQVLVNLVQNALDASPAGARVTVRAHRGPGGATLFEVVDQGPGLAAEVRGRLFTPGATSKAAGSGLGLVIARSIAEQHGGSLRLEERPEGGVRAVFELPAGERSTRS